MAVATPNGRQYRGAWAILLGSGLLSLPLLGGRWLEAMLYGPLDRALVEQLFVFVVALLALQLLVLAVLVVLEYRQQRTYWSAAIPVTIVFAQVIAGLGGVADRVEPAYARSPS